jgi:hypothetical protein
MDRLMQLYRSVGPRWVFVIGFLTFSAIYEYGRVLHLRPLPMHIWRQADCLSLTWNYYTGEATFLKPVIHGQIADGGESGLSAGEFPLLYWAMGQVWKVIGPSEFAYRLFGLLFHFVASYMLFLTLRRLLRSDFWAIGITLLLFTSPVLLYYGVSFLTDVPAFDLALMGWYFFVRHAEEGKRRWWILSTACFALATLLKVTAGMSFVAIIGLYLLFTVRPAWFRSIPKVFPSRVFGWAVIAISLAGIAAWYIHAEQFNTYHAGRYTFNNLWPIWEMTPDEIDRAVTFAKRILLFQIFDTSVLLLIGFTIILLIVHVRELPIPVALLNGLLLLGAIAYTLCWFHAVDGHDYYFINPMISWLVPLVSWLWLLRKRYPDIFHARWLRIGFLLLLCYNVAYARTNLIMRSNPNSLVEDKNLLPTYHRYELELWNNLANPVQNRFQTIAPYLRSIGVQPGDKVISPDDITINASLYFMQQPGFTLYGLDLDDPETYDSLIHFGAKYMVFADEKWWGKEHLRAYFTKPIGRQNGLWILDLTDRPSRKDILLDYHQHQGLLPLEHQIKAVIRKDEWYFPPEPLPLVIDLPRPSPPARFIEIEGRGIIHWEGDHLDGASLALWEDDRTIQKTNGVVPLSEGEFRFVFRIPQWSDAKKYQLRFQNSSGLAFRVERFELQIRNDVLLP